jgi:Icc-related predicted phosphoesterase
MRLVVISDTHGKQNEFPTPIPDGDVLVHAGDYSVFGKYDETKEFLDWFVKHPHPHKIIVFGNHEVGICPLKESFRLWSRGELGIPDYEQKASEECAKTRTMMATYKDRVTYLCDTGIEIDGIKFWGSPWCGGDEWVMENWGFYLRHDIDRKTKFDLIPDDTFVLITHSPPKGILDTAHGMSLGCLVLAERVNVVKPIIHLFGHIHDSYGSHPTQFTDFYNCSNLNEEYQVVNPITVIII